MRKFILIIIFAASIGGAFAQTTSGTFVFTRTVHMKIDGNFEGRQKPPETMEMDFELLFGNNKSLLREAPNPEEIEGGHSGGPRMFRFGMGDAETFCDFTEKRSVAKFPVGDKFYIVEDSFVRRDWKLTNETKEILGHPCRKAITNREMTRMEMNNENGKMTRREFKDTVPIEAWYAEDIPVPAGPSEYNGSLPGMILELNADEGKMIFIATSYRKSFEKKALVAPEGEKVTRDELKAKREEFFKSMAPRN